MRHIHILGICGTFMGGLAVMARELGYRVTGSDQHVYPPMSDTLRNAGIEIIQGFDPQQLHPRPDVVVIGNALSRGNPAVEAVLNDNLPFTSGPQFLAEHILKDRHVLAVSGTHGKTTTTAILTWILTYAGLQPGYLIGGVAKNFPATAALGKAPYFVIEADEYDTAFFDKRPKFIHYHPHTLIVNNIEFDHGDIFKDLPEIKKQFHFLIRTVAGKGRILCPKHDRHVNEVLQEGCWTPVQTYMGDGADWHAQQIAQQGSAFDVYYQQQKLGRVQWDLFGMYNVNNALAAIAAAQHIGIEPAQAIAALAEFKGVKRRLEVRGQVNDITVYDDFAHHPTAIAQTIKALRAKVGSSNIVAILQFGSNTMSNGLHSTHDIVSSLQEADTALLLQPDKKKWDIDAVVEQLSIPAKIFSKTEDIINYLLPVLKPQDQVLIMSNKGFDAIHSKLLQQLQQKEALSS